MSEHAFLDAIREEPEADVHRLVFSDWLDENGQADRAEFVRTQVTLAGMGEHDPRRADLEMRERRLLAPNAAWAGRWPGRAEFRRGLVEAIDVVGPSSDGAWGRFASLPIRDVCFERLTEGAVGRLAGRDELRRVESLAIECDLLGPGIDALLQSGRLEGVRRLSLSADDMTEARAVRWAGSAALAGVERLRIDQWVRSDGSFLRQLARGAMPALTDIAVGRSDAPAHADAVNALVRSEAWPRLRSVFSSSGPGFPWPEALASAPLRRVEVRRPVAHRTTLAAALTAFAGTPTLEELWAPDDFASGEALSRVLAAPALARLRRLGLSSERWSDDDLRRLAGSPVLAGLERLSLCVNRDGGPALAELLGSPHLGRLTRLAVFGRALPRDGALALARGGARRLRRLTFVAGGEDDLVALGEGEPFADLHTLRIHWWQSPRPAALGRLLDGPAFPRLCGVSFTVPSESEEEVAAVVRRCERLAWAGYVADAATERGERVGVKPEGVYLPHLLADL